MQTKNADRHLVIARTATANATREGSIPFGAPVSRPQVLAVEQMLKGKDILKHLACTEKALRAYSRNEVSFAQLPVKTQQRLQGLNGSYAKPWARKSATIAYALLRERKGRKRPSRSKKQEG